MANKTLDALGTFLMERVRDPAISDWQMIIAGAMKGATAEQARKLMADMNIDDRHKEKLLRLFTLIVDTEMHHLLWALEQAESPEILIRMDDEEPTSPRNLSDGLPGELYGSRGWLARFSRYPA